MKLSTTVILAFLLSTLGAYYFWGDKSIRPRADEWAPIRILTFEEGDAVTHLHLTNRSARENFSLLRTESSWQIESPVHSPAEDFLAEGMVQALTFSRRLRRFAWEADGKDEEFGFRPAEIEVGIQTKKQPAERKLLIGKDSPAGMGVFARWEGEKEYFLMPREMKAALDRSLYSLRQKKLFRVKWDDVTWIHAKVEGQEFHIQKSGEAWRWVVPASSKEIPVEKVSELIYAFQSLYVKEFLDGAPAGKKEFGLEASRNFLEVAGRGKTERLELGASAKGKDSVYALRKGENLVLLVSGQNLKTLLETFEVTFHETGNAGPGKSENGSGKNQPLMQAGGKKSV